MHKTLFGLLLALVLCRGPSPALAAGPQFAETEVFVGGQDGINTYRIPGMICTKRGTVLVFCEGRKNSDEDGSPTNLVLKRSLGNVGAWQPSPPSLLGRIPGRRSKAHNLTWEPMQTLISAHGSEAYMNPVPIIDADGGAIFLLVNRYVHYGKEEDSGKGDVQTLLLESTDEGASWTEPLDLTPSVGRAALGPAVGIQMRDGTLVAPTYLGVIYSADHGRTWQSGGQIGSPPNETQIVELADGSLMLNKRSSPNRTVFISKDGGRTWGPPAKDSALTDPKMWGGCQASLIRYTRSGEGYAKNGLLFANPADPEYRFNMTVRMSYDEGKTWPVSKLVRNGTAAYSSTTVFPDGTIGLVYETGNDYNGAAEYCERIDFVRFNLDWLTNGTDQLYQTKGR